MTEPALTRPTPCDVPRCPHAATVLLEMRNTDAREWLGFLCDRHARTIRIASGAAA